MKIDIKSLSYKYDEKKVLHNINLSFNKGKFYGILGPNGSGKTTLIKLMTGLLSKKSGEIFVNNKELDTMSRNEIAKNIAYVPQIFNISQGFSVRDIVLMGRHPYIKRLESPSLEDYEKVEEAFRETNLTGLRDRFVNELSGGETQRVIIARALAQDTGIIVLDEPISQLDIHYQHEIIRFLKYLCEVKGRTIIASLHDINVAVNYCEEVVVMKEGVVKAQGKAFDVVTEGLIEEVYDLKVSIFDGKGRRYIGW
ncbi:iron complex transport system ATP-binding protein [Natranaerovirga pectinivora]|uniref:Iron complex transport system ATP-binding protein n=1 Tax=Natranaerovirga pectinivora TaxID=682400 RepID=A0A4R3MP12_9FIRM|nr:ABC transporter ATP-binding protein [Natranaerovirga pectinivora]TCT13859.1 iron complex transport system ATP-binding protein [Natranaerovirga pectinivora]